MLKHGEELFRVGPGAVPPAALTQVEGMRTFPTVPKVERYMTGNSGVLGLWVFQRNVRLRVSFAVKSSMRPRRVEVIQNGAILWRGTVGTRETKVTFTTRSDSFLKVHCTPGVVGHPRHIGLTLDLTDLQVQRG
jgi:hypothetical protein